MGKTVSKKMIFIKQAEPHAKKTEDNTYPYKSRVDKSIADMLKGYGIPFFYKQPTLVIENGKRCIEYADFFLPTYNGLAIDYIVESNSAIYRRKKNIYQDNQIPAVLMARRDIDHDGWQKRLYKRLEKTYHPRSAYRRRGLYR